MGDPAAMAQGRQQNDLSQDVTAALWEKYRGGKPTECPNDSWPLALSVDAGSSYRFVCTHCGTASPWFDAGASGIQVRNVPPAAEPDYGD